MLAAGQATDSILAATFTRKAAGEIADRALRRLADAALDDRAAAELAEQIGRPEIDAPRAGQLLASLVRSMHRLRIGTLDSFFVQLAGAYSLELGLPPGWSIGEAVADARLRTEALHALLARHPEEVTVLMHALTAGEANRSVDEQLRDVIAEMYAAYLELPREAWQRLPRQPQLDAAELAATLVALEAAPLPADKRAAPARDANCRAAREGDWMTLLTKGLTAKVAAKENTFHGKDLGPALVESCRRLVDHAQAVVVGKLAGQTEAAYELLDRFHGEYLRLKQATRQVRFDDLTWRLSRRELAATLEERFSRLDGGVDHLLLDEFQDTSPPQWDVLRPFAARTCQAGARGRSYFCVGDVKQAIYGWRGGEAEIFDAMTHDLPGLETKSLATSFRSAPEVIHAVNAVFAGLIANPAIAKLSRGVAGWLAGFETHSTAREKSPGYVRMMTAPAAQDGEEQSAATLRYAAEETARLHREAPERSLGVLLRTNAAVGRMLYELGLHGVRASGESGNPLTTSPAVTLVLSALTLADHPGDAAARFHVATSPLAAVLGLPRHDDDDLACRAAREIRAALLADGYGLTIERWASALGPACPASDRLRLGQLVEMAHDYARDETLRPGEFVELVEHVRVDDPTASPVRAMTVHQAKGLEFDIVLLPELDKQVRGQTPRLVTARPAGSDSVGVACRYANAAVQPLLPRAVREAFDLRLERQVREALCVFYVALTRAAHALHLVVAPSGPKEKSLPATFAGILRWSLLQSEDPLPAESTTWERGDPHWWSRLPPAPPSAPSPPESPRLPAPPVGRHKGLPRRAPSSLEGGPLAVLADRLRFNQAAAFERGTLFHAWFEQVAWLDDGEPDEATLLRVAAQKSPGQPDLPGLLAQFRKALAQPRVRAALHRQAYGNVPADSLRLWRERPFAVRLTDELLSGAIDRLVTVREGGRTARADVLDFKTDRVSPGDEATLVRLVAHYRPQMAAYRRAAAQFCRLPLAQVTARLVFVEAGDVREA